MPKIVKLRVAPRGTYALWRDALFYFHIAPTTRRPARTARTNRRRNDKMKRTKSAALAFLLTLCFTLGLLPALTLTASAATNVSYLDASGATQTVASATSVTSSSTTWSAGWYVVDSAVTISSRITVSGAVNLILADGKTLTASAGITVTGSNSLTIYAQSTGTNMGKLSASATDSSQDAGIGGGNNQSGGTITINGGSVMATGVNRSAGIGGGNNQSGGTITINGGTVTANGGLYAAGIGGGDSGSGGAITINGGAVTAQGGGSGAGIGGGYSGASGAIAITGGTVTANGNVGGESSDGGAGIGGGEVGAGGTIKITGGTVTATVPSGTLGAAIGNGGGSSGTDATVTVGGSASTIVASANSSGSGATSKTAADVANNASYKYVKYTVTPVAVTGVTLSPATLTLTPGGNTATLTATVSPDNASNTTLTWSTSNASVATVKNGVVTSVAAGTATITATSNNGKTATCTVTVAVPVTGVSLNQTTLNLTAGGNAATLTATVAPNNATDKTVKWSVSGSSVKLYSNSTCTTEVGAGATSTLTVYAKGVSDGSATVTVTSNADNTKSASCTVTVHAHNFGSTYQLTQTNAPNDTITATCSADDCNLTDGKASLTILAPDEAGGAAALYGDADAFGVSASDIKYYQKSGSDWTEIDGTPSEGGFFKGSLTIASDYTIEAAYGVNAITIASGIENGAITAPPVATVGAVVPLTITPAEAWYELDTLTVTKKAGGVAVDIVDADGGGKSFFMPDEEVTVSATFKLTDYAITLPEDDTVTATVGGQAATSAHYNDTVTLGNNPATGYQFSAYTVTKTGDTTTTVAVTDGAFSMPAYPVTVTVTFAAIDYNVTLTQPTDGSGSIGADKTTANFGDEITLSATPSAGFELDAFTVKDADNNEVAVANNKFTMPAQSVAVTAAFKKIDYAVTVNSATNGAVGASLTTAQIGDEITLTVTPTSGYALASLTVKDADNNDVAVTDNKFAMPASNVTVTATFGELTTYTIFYRASGSPDSVKFRTANSGDGYAMVSSAKLGGIDCWAIQFGAAKDKTKVPAAFSTDGGNTWDALTEWDVADDIPSDLAEGSAVAIEGEAKAFVAAFVWGEDTDTDTDTDSHSLYYLVTTNTQSVNVPNPADTASESFKGWTYLVPSSEEGGEAEKITVNKSSSGNATTAPLDKMSQTTIVSAIWTPNSYTVSFNPDNGTAATNMTVAYGNKVTPPANPAKAGYEFAGWALAGNAVEKVGDKTLQFSAGTAFDFENISIINNLSLKAKWKHVHAYVCLQLDNAVFGGAFADYYGYKGQLHIKLCTSWDDYCVEAHSFVNGKCACGASVLDNKVTLTEYVGDTSSATKAVKNSIVSIFAPQKQGAQVFSKWRYSADTTNGQNGTWYDLSAMRGVAFAIPANMSVKAVYEAEPFKLAINSFKYDSTHVAFQFNYSVPDGFTVVDGGLMIGDNVRMKFWDCTLNLYILGHVREPSLKNAVTVFGGGTIANNMLNYQTINQPGVATPIKKALTAFGKTGTLALAWEPYDRAGYKNAIRAGQENENYDQAKYPTYAMGYIICKNKQGGYVGFMTNAISATLENPTSSHTATIPVS